MDYLVFGVGFGATLVLVGWVLRQYGPRLRFRDSADAVLSAEQLLERNDWQRFCVALGALLSVGGAVMLLAPLVTMLIHPSDSVGTIIVGVIFVLSLIAVAGWIVMYVNQHRALADDRRAEAVAESRARKNASTREATTTDPATKERDTAEAKAPAKTTSSETAGERASHPTSQSRRPTGERAAQPATVPTTTTTTTRRPSTAAPAARERHPEPAAESPARNVAKPDSTSSAPSRPTRSAATPEGRPATTPNPALRNVRFKRTAANRTQQERHPAPISEPIAHDETDDASRD